MNSIAPVVLLSHQGTHVTPMFGHVREVTARRLRVWFGEFPFQTFAFDKEGRPVGGDAAYLGDCRLVARAEFDAVCRFLEIVELLRTGQVLTLEVVEDTATRAKLYHHV